MSSLLGKPPHSRPERTTKSLTAISFATISIVWYFIRGRTDFHGPPVLQDAEPAITGQAVTSDQEKAAYSPTIDGSDDLKT